MRLVILLVGLGLLAIGVIGIMIGSNVIAGISLSGDLTWVNVGLIFLFLGVVGIVIATMGMREKKAKETSAKETG